MDVKRGKKDKNGAKDTSKDINPKSGGKEVPKAHGKDKAPGTHTSYIFFLSLVVHHIASGSFRLELITSISFDFPLSRKSQKCKQIR